MPTWKYTAQTLIQHARAHIHTEHICIYMYICIYKIIMYLGSNPSFMDISFKVIDLDYLLSFLLSFSCVLKSEVYFRKIPTYILFSNHFTYRHKNHEILCVNLEGNSRTHKHARARWVYIYRSGNRRAGFEKFEQETSFNEGMKKYIEHLANCVILNCDDFEK